MTWSEYLNNELRFLDLTAEELEYHINKLNEQMKILDSVRLQLLECQDINRDINLQILNEYERLNDQKHKFIRRLKELSKG